MFAVLALAWAPHASAQNACRGVADQIRRDGEPNLNTDSPRTLKQTLPATFKPTPALAAALSKLAGSGGDPLNLRHTGHGALHAAFAGAGSANCQSYVFFELAPDGRADEVAGPPIYVNDSDGTLLFCTGFAVWSAIGQMGDDPAFIAEIGRDQDEEVRLTPWRDHAWQQECRIAIHYAADFAVYEQYCKSIDCAMVGERARALAMQFDKDPGSFAQLPKVDNKALALLSGSPELPTFGKASPSLQGFSEDSVAFLVVLDGATFIARLGHGAIGWRRSPNYVFALYRPPNRSDVDALEPVAGIHIAKTRTKPVEVTVK